MSNTPMNIDEFITLDNKTDDAPPAELVELQQRSPLYLTALKPELKAEMRLTERLNMNRVPNANRGVWELDLGQEFILGQLGEDGEAIARPKSAEREVKSAKPNIPSWSGITYHPKLSEPRFVPPFRGAKGKRVIPHYVFEPDERQVYYPDSYPWRCIGKILVWTNPSGGYAWSGTGVLVGRNIVLTCSHLCPWGVSPWMMQFIPAYYDGVSLLGSGVYSYVQTYRGYRDHGQGDDMAVLKLYTPLGDSLGWFGSKTYDDDWEDGAYWTKCGYPGAIASAQRPSRITWFPIIDDDNDGAGVELEYHADASNGDSGGPVFGWWDDGPHVIGTHSGGEEEYQFPFSIVRNNVAAGGSALPNLIIWAQNNW